MSYSSISTKRSIAISAIAKSATAIHFFYLWGLDRGSAGGDGSDGGATSAVVVGPQSPQSPGIGPMGSGSLSSPDFRWK